MDCKYDYVISLGYNCEVSFRIEDFFGNLDAFLYSWSYELDRQLFIRSLSQINAVFTDPSLEDNHMFKCNTYQIRFHPRYDIIPQSGSYSKEQYANALEELKSRLAHLKQKTENVLQSDKAKLFLVKIEDKGEQDNIRYIQTLYETLKAVCFEHSFTMICILEKKSVTPNIKRLENENLFIHSLSHFAPVKHTDIFGDLIGWNKLLSSVTDYHSTCYYKNVYKRWKKTIPLMVINKISRIRGKHCE